MKDYRLQVDSCEKSASLSWDQMKGLVSYFSKQSLWFVLAVLAILGSTSASVGIPYFISLGVDKAIPYNDLSYLSYLLKITGFLALVALSLGFFQAYVLGRLSQNFLFRLRSALFEKLQELPQAFFTQNKTGDLLSRINSDSDKMAQFFSSGANRWFSNIFTLLGILVFMCVLSPFLTGILLCVALVAVLISRALSKLSRRLSRNALASNAGFSAIVSENLQAFKAVILLSRRQDWVRMLLHANEKNAQANFHSTFVSGLFAFVYLILGNFSQILILTVGLFIYAKGYSTIGILISFLTYTQRFYAALGQLGVVWGEAQLAVAAWDRLSLLLSLKTHLSQLPKTQEKDPKAPILQLRHVSFAYKEEEFVLKDVSLDFQKCKTYAVVGPTGGGKSTLVSLMTRLIDPCSGFVRLQGQDLRSLSREEIAAKIGVILQEPFLFKGTLADNLRYANPILENCSVQQLYERVQEMGLNSVLESFGGDFCLSFNEGADSLSLGQKQLVSFLRAVLRSPEVLILDEATANIDTSTEKKLAEVLHSLTGKTTQIIIAHRLATIERADEVIFINRHYVRSGLSYKEAVELVHSARLGS